MNSGTNVPSVVELLRLVREQLEAGGLDGTQSTQSRDVGHLLECSEIRQSDLEHQVAYLNTIRLELETALNLGMELWELSPVGILTLDARGLITRANRAACQLLQMDRSQLVGRALARHLIENDRPVLASLMEQAGRVGIEQVGEGSLARNELFAHHVQIRISALSHAGGWQVVLADLTARWRRAEQERVIEERWRLALEASGDGAWDWNVQTGEVIYSRRYEELYGFSEGQYGHHLEDWSQRLHPDDKPAVMAQILETLGGRTASYFNEHRGRCKDGSWKWILARGAVVVRAEDGTPLRMVGTDVDISSRKKAEEALRESVQFQQSVFDALTAQIAVLDSRGVVLQTNAAWRNHAMATQWSDASSGIGLSFLEVLERLAENDEPTASSVSRGMESVMMGEIAHFSLAQPFLVPSINRWFTLKITPVHDDERRIVISLEDVSELKAAELASWTLANVDALTGALSRRNFLNLADQELARSTRYELPLMVLMLDLDHFKRVNDRYGHAAGDAVLQGFVQTVAGVLRESDFIGRVGGEEFAVLLPNTTLEGGCALAQRIIESVRANPVEMDDQRIAYTVSIGAGCLSKETSFSSLLGLADSALYRAKEAGRDRLEVGSHSAAV